MQLPLKRWAAVIMFLFGVFGFLDLAAQNLTVSGTVKSTSGDPLPGVSVAIRGTTQGTVSDLQGKYTLANIPGNSVLQFSFVGMKSADVNVSGRTVVDVVLEEETIGLDEVVASDMER